MTDLRVTIQHENYELLSLVQTIEKIITEQDVNKTV